jgi:hypothetical protein
LLREADAVAGEGDVVIGRKQGDQANNETTDGLGETEAVETEPVETEAVESEPVEAEAPEALR